jgi:hypothetical protein
VYAEGWAIARWPGDPNLVLAGLTELEQRLGHLALVDLTRPRFLSGTVRVGTGPAAVGRLKTDTVRRRLWAVLPWSAEVIRVRER